VTAVTSGLDRRLIASGGGMRGPPTIAAVAMPKAAPSPAAVTAALGALVRAAGGRATPARTAVLGLLRSVPQPLTQREVEDALTEAGHAFDRVTLYRALEWLEANGLAHKISGEDRVWRFRSSGDGHHEHAHFQCRACGSTICLDGVAPPPAAKAPRGYRVESSVLTLRGLCPACKT
jgi:Fur family transcriptional regulator, ferric uptake regulator